jgi:SpoU rRNA methylase family enzyme
MVRHPIVVIHDVSSAQRLLDVAHVVYGLGFDVLVASKVYGAAASSAVPDATRMALRLGKSFHVLPGVRDAVEIFKPSRIVVLSKEYGEPRSLEEIVGMLRGNTMLVL